MRISHRPSPAAIALATLLAACGAAVAETNATLDADDSGATLAGSYLAGRSADRAKDITAAALFFGRALAVDPSNAGLMERVVVLELAGGDVDQSLALAARLVEFDDANPIARVALAVKAVKDKRSEGARANLAKIAPADLGTLTAGLMNAWVAFGEGKVDAAVKTIDDLRGPEWYAIFKDYHTALILDAAGRHDLAVAAIKRAYTTDTTALRVVDGYARIMARAGQRDEAIRALVDFAGDSPLHPTVRELLREIRAGSTVPPTAATTEAGVAEVLYGLGSAIGLEDGPELSATYLRLAAYLAPEDYLITMAIGDAFQGVDRCDDAIRIYETVPRAANLRRNADIQIGACLQILERYEEAVKYLVPVVAASGDDAEAAVQLGNAYRADSRFVEAAAAYTRALEASVNADTVDWRIYYFRGVSLERSKRWPEADADFRKALELNPDQPQVLNYLGYSLVDQGLNLDEALAMIRKAVDARPNDGYIIDSLGWAYYRLQRYEDAVTALETAAELRADDPVINDHLGDAYWRVGRKREAMFQWAHARDLRPEDDELPKILAKLEHGLDGVPGKNSVTVEKGESLWDIALRVYGDAEEYARILDANKDRITDPNLIYPGMTLVLPAPATN